MSKEYYIAERDEDTKGRPSVWIVSKDEKEDYTFVLVGNTYALMDSSVEKLDADNYAEVRKLVNSL